MVKLSLILTLIGVFGFFYDGLGQTSSPVRIKFEPKYRSACFGSSLDYAAKLTNNGNNSIVIDANRIGSIIYFDRLVNNTEKLDLLGSVAIGESLTSHYRPNFIVLQSMESYDINQSLVLKRDSFSKPGRYRVRVGYEQTLNNTFEGIDVWEGTTTSNPVVISINGCR